MLTSPKIRNSAGLIILAVLWIIIIAIWYWPREAAEQDVAGKDQTDQLATATPDPSGIQVMPIGTPGEGGHTPAPIVPSPTPLPSPTPVLIYTVDHVIQPGETLQSIALKYQTSIGLLATTLTVDQLCPGNLVAIPVPNPIACPSSKLHVVSEHETLYGIAVRFETTVGDLKTANGLLDDLIRVGQVLCLP